MFLKMKFEKNESQTGLNNYCVLFYMGIAFAELQNFSKGNKVFEETRTDNSYSLVEL